jgi:transposase
MIMKIAKQDGRKISHEALEFIRSNAVRRIEQGERVADVMASYGLSRTAAYPWLRKTKKQGIASLASTKSQGPKPLLSESQCREVRRWICGKDPRQFAIDFGLWTRQIVQKLIKENFFIDISISSVGTLLARLQITPQKPLQRAYQRDPQAIARWREIEYPAIKAAAKRQKGQIFFLDEAGFTTDDTYGKTWAPRGKTPIVSVDGRRQRINAISAVAPNGAFWHNVYTGKLDSDLFIEFLTDLAKRNLGQIHLILDSLPLHKSKAVQQFVELNKKHLTLHFLPTYAPELNPDELVWHYMKSHGTVKRPLRENESLKERVISDLKALKRNKKLLTSFFQEKNVFYAAA